MSEYSRNIGFGALIGFGIYGAYKYVSAKQVTVTNSAELGSKYSELIKKCRSIKNGYWPSFFSLSATLELLPFMIIGSRKSLRLPNDIEEVEMEDGETLQIVWFKNETNGTSIPSYCEKNTTPIVILHHGAMCNGMDLPGQGYIKQALEREWHVCALNRRGHTKRPLKVPKFHFFGSTDDTRAIVQYVRATKRPSAPIYMIGLSSGSGLVAKFIGEQGQQLITSSHPSFVNGVIGVSPGYNIEKCMGRMEWPYQQILLDRAKDYFLRRNHDLLCSVAGYAEMSSAKSFQSFLDSSYGAAGYRSKEEFYLKTNPMETVQFIIDPALFINAENDPVCVKQNIDENMHHFSTSQGATLVTTKVGSHLPFYQISWNPFKFECWAESLAYEYIDQIEICRREDEACRMRDEHMVGLSPASRSYPSPLRISTPAQSPSRSPASALSKSMDSSPQPSKNNDEDTLVNASTPHADPSARTATPVSIGSSTPSSPWSTVKSPRDDSRNIFH